MNLAIDCADRNFKYIRSVLLSHFAGMIFASLAVSTCALHASIQGSMAPADTCPTEIRVISVLFFVIACCFLAYGHYEAFEVIETTANPPLALFTWYTISSKCTTRIDKPSLHRNAMANLLFISVHLLGMAGFIWFDVGLETFIYSLLDIINKFG